MRGFQRAGKKGQDILESRSLVPPLTAVPAGEGKLSVRDSPAGREEGAESTWQPLEGLSVGAVRWQEPGHKATPVPSAEDFLWRTLLCPLHTLELI